MYKRYYSFMCMILKFGGSSLQNRDILSKVITIIMKKTVKTNTLVVVCSACGNTTNTLLSIIPFIEKNNIFKVQQILRFIYDYHNSLLELSLSSEFNDFYNEIKEFCMNILGKKVDSKNTARLIGYGELFSSCILSTMLKGSVVNSLDIVNKTNIVKIDCRKVVKTDSKYLNANLKYNVTYENIKQTIANSPKSQNQKIIIAPGFIGSNLKGESTVLGRGGSDLTASLFAIALNSKHVEIWSDRDGIMTSDPRYINGTQLIERLTYDQLFNLSYYGAKIVFYKTVLPLFGKKIYTWIKNTYNPENRGTLICSPDRKSVEDEYVVNTINNSDYKDNSRDKNNNQENKVLAITTLSDIVLIKIYGIKIKQCIGFSTKVFQSLSDKGINIIAISQESSEFSIHICIDSKEAKKAKSVLEWVFVKEIRQDELNFSYFKQISVVSLIHQDKKYRNYILQECSHLIHKEQIPVYILNAGDHITCFVTDTTYSTSICQTLHDTFFKNVNTPLPDTTTNTKLTTITPITSSTTIPPTTPKTITSTTPKTITSTTTPTTITPTTTPKTITSTTPTTSHPATTPKTIKNKKMLTTVIILGLGNVGTCVFSMLQKIENFMVICVSNSRGHIYQKDGLIEDSDVYRKKLYSEQMEKNSLSLVKLVSIYYAQTNKCIVVDTTSSEQIVQWYPTFIQQKIPFVVANKKGLSGDITLFNKLSDAYKQNLFQFETTVCAGLPVLDTLCSLIKANHNITKIEGILSGTCNFVCTQLETDNHTFSTIIKNALDKGITEPHPYDDLCGMDVARKLLILARCCGEKIGLEDIEVEPLVSIPKKEVSTYLAECSQFDEEFSAYSKLENSKVKYIATYDNTLPITKYTIKKQIIDNTHPFYSVNNTLNVVAIYTNIYTQPLVISGFGAGIGATAAGVVSDIVKLCS